ncbi:hypothetical protein [Serinibacter salmoneus]|uniref:Copper(I)-binding protein n=1 Tax=Serinibacter salmoneus TaxID=556530 RepID=A0A2A9D421_9MICO|nr:hypothetical protein [Serinibacter salmoneus]PFG20599.1 hypothetical protein ATL40_2206 [Serinibacter salmoneus]
MSRTATTGGLIAVAALALTACSPVTTLEPYAASDGVRVVWDEDDTSIRGENVLLLTAEAGAEARMVGGLTNLTSEATEITAAFSDGTLIDTFPLEAGETLLLDGEATRDVLIEASPVAPGENASVVFTTPTLGAVEVSVPVLDATLAEYEDYVP